jgi:hypothetical protein
VLLGPQESTPCTLTNQITLVKSNDGKATVSECADIGLVRCNKPLNVSRPFASATVHMELPPGHPGQQRGMSGGSTSVWVAGHRKRVGALCPGSGCRMAHI